MTVLFGIANLVALFLLWRHIDKRDDAIRDLSERVARVEAQQMSASEYREFLGRLANIEGRLATVTDLMETIQDHLLERDK
jgi:hypothetical protein